MYENRVYNLHRDSPATDKTYVSSNLKFSGSLHTLDYRKYCPPVYYQDNIGSCTACSLCCIYYFEITKGGTYAFDLSKLFLYYNTRMLKKSVYIDTGCSMREALISFKTYGVCPESVWEYNIEKFAVQPSDDAYALAINHNNILYERVEQNIDDMKQCLVDGQLFAFGMAVYSRFESKEVEKTGIVTLPEADEMYKGGHAVCAVGFDDDRESFLIRNSWGEKWGISGYFYLSYDYMINNDLVYDIWTLKINCNKEQKCSMF